MKKRVWVVSLVLVAACGKGEPLLSQESQRKAFEPELQGTWSSTCAAKKIDSVTIGGGGMTFQTTSFHDPECESKERTVAHAGSYSLAVNYKSGVENSVVFQAGPEVAVTLHTDYDVDTQNNVLTAVNAEKEKEISTGLSPGARKNITRENLKIRAAKALAVWKRDEPKILNRFQLEKLQAAGLAASPVAEQGSRVVLRYEVDNGYLQLGGRLYYQPAGN